MKAINFRVFDHGTNSPTNDRFSTFARSLTTKNGTKIETVASTTSINMLFSIFFVFTRKDLCCGTRRQVIREMFTNAV